MTALGSEATWPPAWRAVADAIRAAIATGQTLNHRREVMRAAGLGRGPACKTGVVDAMIRAGVLLWQKPSGFGTVTRYRLVHSEEWTPQAPPSADEAALAAEREQVLSRLRQDIASGTAITSFREWVRSAGVAPDRAQPVATALLREYVTRETQQGAEGMAKAVRFRIAGTNLVSPWAALRPAVRQATYKALPAPRGGKRQQSEADLQNLIQAHIARHGVTRIESGSDYPAPIPVRGKVMGDGMVGRGGGA